MRKLNIEFLNPKLQVESISIVSNESKIHESWMRANSQWLDILAVFQCLIAAGENDSEERKRDAGEFLVTDEPWRTFCDRHKHLDYYVPEDNSSMASSYLLLDENTCFLDKGEGMMTKSDSSLDVGVERAMQQVKWDRESFVERGGIYDWSSKRATDRAKALEW
jgi:radical S-adenosyl methionine domain-containing protein 2